MTTLAGLRILDLTGIEGAYAGKLLADLGAEVVRVIGPEGDPMSSEPPPGPGSDPLRSLSYEHFLTGRRSIMLDPATERGADSFAMLMAGANGLVESLSADGRRRWSLDDHDLHVRYSGLVHVAISAYGRQGPLADAPWSELAAASAGGLIYLIGEPDRPPVQLGGHQLFHLSSLYAAAATLLGIRRGRSNRRGACIDLSMQEIAFSITNDRQLAVMQTLTHAPPRRTGNQTPHFYPFRNFACRDGWVTICALEPKQWSVLADWIAEVTGDASVHDARYAGRGYDRARFAGELDPLIRAFCQRFDKQSLYLEGQLRGIPIMPANSVADLLADPQLEARAFFETRTLESGRTVRLPGRPYRLASSAEPIQPAPNPGGDSGDFASGGATAPPPSADSQSSSLPLRGVRVLEVGWYVAAPWIGIQMARQGAEVIKVETTKSVDIMRLVPIINEIPTGADYPSLGGGKRSITLDLRMPAGRSLLQRLIAQSDIVTENFSLEAGRRFGLDWATVSAANPRAILLRMPGFGLEGPASEFVSYGMAMSALAGLDLITGYEDGPPGGNSISYPDYVAALHGLVVILAALHHRNETGLGQQIELSQFESTVAVLGPAFLDYQANGVIGRRRGNRDERWAPQGVYPGAGDDRWFALSIQDDKTWAAFAAMLAGRMTAPEFATVSGRRAAHTEIDEAIADWGRSMAAEEAVRRARSIGAAVSIVATSADIVDDVQLAARRFFRRLNVPGYGVLPFARSPISLDFETGIPESPHELGEDNQYVFRELLGVDPADYNRLVEEGVIQ